MSETEAEARAIQHALQASRYASFTPTPVTTPVAAPAYSSDVVAYAGPEVRPASTTSREVRASSEGIPGPEIGTIPSQVPSRSPDQTQVSPPPGSSPSISPIAGSASMPFVGTYTDSQGHLWLIYSDMNKFYAYPQTPPPGGEGKYISNWVLNGDPVRSAGAAIETFLSQFVFWNVPSTSTTSPTSMPVAGAATAPAAGSPSQGGFNWAWLIVIGLIILAVVAFASASGGKKQRRRRRRRERS